MPDLTQLTSLDLGELIEIVKNPTSNLTAAALIGAAFIVLLLILVVLAWMFLLTTEAPSAKQESPSGTGSTRVKAPRKRIRLPRWVPFAVVLALLVVLVGLSAASSRDSHCLGCHTESGRPDTVETRHARCVDCHEPPSVVFVVSNGATRLRMESSRIGGEGVANGDYEALVGNASCLRCHDVEELDEGAWASAEASGSVGVVMRHAEPVAAGMRCVECHGSVGAHVSVDADGGHPTMRLCIDCHNDILAPTECATCHVADPVQAARTDPTPVEMTRLEKPRDCTGCHSVESCDACHGIRLPHSEEFIKGGHGYQAAFGKRKSACAWCHEGTWCLEKCHQGGNWKDPNAMWGHPGDWATRHAQFEATDCTNCHSKRFTCESCHPE